VTDDQDQDRFGPPELPGLPRPRRPVG